MKQTFVIIICADVECKLTHMYDYLYCNLILLCPSIAIRIAIKTFRHICLNRDINHVTFVQELSLNRKDVVRADYIFIGAKCVVRFWSLPFLFLENRK